MIDQSFSSKNIEEIFDHENKRGINLERKFEDTFKESLDLSAQLKYLRRKIKYEKDPETKKTDIETLNQAKDLRKEILNNIFENISSNIKKYNPCLQSKEINGLNCFTLKNTVESYFYSKIIQKNLREVYKIKQPSRYQILKTLIHFIEDKFPKIIIRTDIEKFYDSIPQDTITDLLKTDHLININSRRCITKILENFNTLTANTNRIGLPKGIGISAYLSEIYMKKIDSKINSLENLMYYARYVDDIIVIFSESKGKSSEDYKIEIAKIIADSSDQALLINDLKTNPYHFRSGDLSQNIVSKIVDSNIQTNFNKNPITYLGYEIGFKEIQNTAKNKTTYELIIDITDNKVDEYKIKIKLAFEHFRKKKGHNPRNALKLLESRLNYLLTNTQLSNNKSNVFIGLYYSYPFINTDQNLNKLDDCLKECINTSGLSQLVKLKLGQLSFYNSHNNKLLVQHCFNNKVYMGENTNKKNRGIIKFGIKEITAIWK